MFESGFRSLALAALLALGGFGLLTLAMGVAHFLPSGVPGSQEDAGAGSSISPSGGSGLIPGLAAPTAASISLLPAS